MFCVDLRTISDYFPIQHYLTGLYNRNGVCLLRGTDWVLKYNFHLKSITALLLFHAMDRRKIELWIENIWMEIAIDQSDIWSRPSLSLNE